MYKPPLIVQLLISSVDRDSLKREDDILAVHGMGLETTFGTLTRNSFPSQTPANWAHSIHTRANTDLRITQLQ